MKREAPFQTVPSHTDTERDTDTENPVLLRKTPAGGFPKNGTNGYAVLKAVMVALNAKGMPAPDEKLKRIVGGQATALLKSGYSFEVVRHFAVELALSWDNAKGHQRLLGLRQAVLQDAADRDYAAHEARKREAKDLIPADPAVARALFDAMKRRSSPEARAGWAVGCARNSCDRTAIYSTLYCADHTERPLLGAHLLRRMR